MSLAQLESHHTAQPVQSTSHSVNRPPQAQPILDPLQTLPKYQISCIINSVYYHRDNENDRCAVLLEVGFLPSLMRREHFISALFPIHVPGVVLDRFPRHDEEVKMERYDVKDGFAFALNVQAPGGVGINVGGINREINKIVYRCLHLRSQTVRNDLHWEFINETHHHFPSAVKLLLLVPGGSGSNSSPKFTFTLEIRRTLEVHANLNKRGWRLLKATTILKPGPDDDGWDCEIRDDYDPTIAKSVLEERAILRPGEHSQVVGLHAVVPVHL